MNSMHHVFPVESTNGIKPFIKLFIELFIKPFNNHFGMISSYMVGKNTNHDKFRFFSMKNLWTRTGFQYLESLRCADLAGARDSQGAG